MKRVDVAIIGGSLAGAACVRELSRRGVDALAFERDAFPREKVCGGFLSPGAVELLDELGVLGEVRLAGAVDVGSARVRFGDVDTRFELPKPGLGISRRALDEILGNHGGVVHAPVRTVRKVADGFRVELGDGEVAARVVVDGAGKLSRFTERVTADQFGVQFYEPETRGDVLDFWFFRDGYGGAVTVEGGRANACFLISKDALPRYLGKPRCLVTGPIAYERRVSEFIAIGDAAGMIDPFCGEGMRHALDTGRLAAQAVAEGLARGDGYDAMRVRYERERARHWAGKRRLGSVVRWLLKYPPVAAMGFRWKPEYFPRLFWGS
jgi:flavin-dependent dehydrogenase